MTESPTATNEILRGDWVWVKGDTAESRDPFVDGMVNAEALSYAKPGETVGIRPVFPLDFTN